MKKSRFTKLGSLFLGLSMALGVGAAISAKKVSEAKAEEGTILAEVTSVGNYGRHTDSPDSKNASKFWVTIGQSGYFGINSAANNTGAKAGVNIDDLPVAKAVDSNATSSTATTNNSCTGYYVFHSQNSTYKNVGSLEFYYSANSGNNSATGYVVMCDTASTSNSKTWSLVPLATDSPAKQGDSLGTSGTFVYKFAQTQSNAMYYGFVIATSSYKRMTGGKITLKEGSTSSTKTLESISLSGSLGKMEYTTDDTGFDLSNIKVTATYSDSSTDDVTNEATLTTTPEVPTEGITSVTVNASYEGKNASKVIDGITVTKSLMHSVTFVAGTDKGSTTANGTPDSVTKSGITIDSSDAALATDEYRFYGDSTLTISSTVGLMVKIEFTDAGTTRQASSLSLLSGNEGAYSYSNGIGTWQYATGSTSVSFSLSAQVRSSSVKITYLEPDENEPSFVFSTKTLSLNVEENGTLEYAANNIGNNVISFTSSNSNVATVSAGTDICNVSALSIGTSTITGSVTVNSNTLSDTAIVNVSGTTTIANALTLGSGLGNGNTTGYTVTVTGVVSNLDKSNSCFDLTQEGNTIHIYGLFSNVDLYNDIVNDATVTVKGNLNVYNSELQIKNITLSDLIVPQVSVTGVTLDKTEIKLLEGNTQQLTANVTPDSASDRVVSWSTNNSGVATVSDSGLVTAVSEGTATITVTTHDGGLTATCLVTVSKFTSEVFTLVKKASDLSAGDEVIIAAAEYDVAMSIIQNSNNRSQCSITKSGNSLTSTEDTQVFTLETGNKTGTFAFSTGNGYIYASSSSSNNLKTESTLSDNSSWSINITSEGVATVVAQGNYTRNTLQYNQSSSLFACYASASQKAVAIYKKGVAEPVHVESVSLNETSKTLETGNTLQLTATVLPADADDLSVSWSTDKESVARVSDSGLVTAVAEGTATITATTNDGGKTASCTVTVEGAPIGETVNYSLVTSNDELSAGGKYLIIGIKEDSYYAISAYDSGNNIKGYGVSTPVNGVITMNSADVLAEITLGGAAGNWTLFDGTNYLYAAGGTGKNNYLKGIDSADELNAQWTISVTEAGVATIITADTTVARNTMRFNTNGTSDPLFSCYASGQTDVYLYKLVETQADEFLSLVVSKGEDWNKSIYTAGDAPVADGLVVTANYTLDGTTISKSEDVTAYVTEWEFNKKRLSVSDTSFTVTAEWDGHKSASFRVSELTVNCPDKPLTNGRYYLMTADGQYGLSGQIYVGSDSPTNIDLTTNNELKAFDVNVVYNNEYQISIHPEGSGTCSLMFNSTSTSDSYQNYIRVTDGNAGVANNTWYFVAADGGFILRQNTVGTTYRYLKCGTNGEWLGTTNIDNATVVKFIAEGSLAKGIANSLLNDIVCDNGVTAPSIETWNAIAAEFAALTISYERELLTNGNGNASSSSEIEKALAKYDYIVGKYGSSTYADFLDRGPTSPARYGLSLGLDELKDSTWIVAVVAIAGLTAIGGCFFYRKRKQY